MPHSLSVLSSMATRQILQELLASYGKQSGIELTLQAVGGVDAARRVRAAEPWDVVVLAAPAIGALVQEGHLASGYQVAVARSGMAAAVPEGGRCFPFENEAAVRKAMLDARSVAYSTGPSGDHLKQLWMRWGIVDAVKSIQAPPGVPVATLLARGEAELGFQQRSELLGMPGITILGDLPGDIQAVTVFTAGIASQGGCLEHAAALLRFLTSSEADAVKFRHGMAPA